MSKNVPSGCELDNVGALLGYGEDDDVAASHATVARPTPRQTNPLCGHQKYANTSHGASIGCLHDERLALAENYPVQLRQVGHRLSVALDRPLAGAGWDQVDNEA